MSITETVEWGCDDDGMGEEGHKMKHMNDPLLGKEEAKEIPSATKRCRRDKVSSFCCHHYTAVRSIHTTIPTKLLVDE